MSTYRTHWTENAERVTDGDWRILAEDEDGTLLVPWPTPGFPDHYWRGRYNPRNPRHWRYWLRSRLTNRIAWVADE